MDLLTTLTTTDNTTWTMPAGTGTPAPPRARSGGWAPRATAEPRPRAASGITAAEGGTDITGTGGQAGTDPGTGCPCPAGATGTATTGTQAGSPPSGMVCDNWWKSRSSIFTYDFRPEDLNARRPSPRLHPCLVLNSNNFFTVILFKYPELYCACT